MGWLKKILLRRKQRKLLIKARVFASNDQDLDAIRVLRAIFLEYGHEVPNIDSPIIANLFYASLNQQQGNMLQAFNACNIFMEQIYNVSISGRLSKEDKDYLKYKCKWILSGLSEYADSEAFKLALAINTTYDALEFNKVSNDIKRFFPINVESGRQLDNYIIMNS